MYYSNGKEGEMVQRRKALKVLKKNGWWLERHGANHDVYTNGFSKEPIPRHGDLNKYTWQGIVKRNNLK